MTEMTGDEWHDRMIGTIWNDWNDLEMIGTIWGDRNDRG